MKKIALLTVAGLLVGACASPAEKHDQHALYAQYTHYVSILAKHQYNEAIDALSDRNIADLTTEAGRSAFQSHFPVVSTINEVLSRETGAFETIKAGIGCLTVTGFDESNEPTSMNIEYVYEHGSWKLDYVQVVYHETLAQQPSGAMCPSRPLP